jgi:D-alanyl-lipoteichoic acid acyltransferase DltB (MBOAT superfamily)
MIVMGLGGLWHGAALSYLARGTMHGVLLVLERAIFGNVDLNPRWETIVRPARIGIVPRQKRLAPRGDQGTLIYVDSRT